MTGVAVTQATGAVAGRRDLRSASCWREGEKNRAVCDALLRALAKHDTYMGITVGENEGLERPKDLYDGTPEAFRDYWSYANEFRAEMKNREKALKRAIYGEKERNPDVRVVDERGRAHGRTRKTSVASVWAWEDAENAGQFTVNGRPVSEFFNSTKDIDHAIEPLVETAMGLEVQVDCHVHGGGKSGQSGAVRMGVASGAAAPRSNFALAAQGGWISHQRCQVQRTKGARAAQSTQKVPVDKSDEERQAALSYAFACRIYVLARNAFSLTCLSKYR